MSPHIFLKNIYFTYTIKKQLTQYSPSFQQIKFIRWIFFFSAVLYFSDAVAGNFKRPVYLSNSFYFTASNYQPNSIDSVPKTNKDTVVIPFEYKQSALYQKYTLRAIDSVINILLKLDSVTLTINGYAHVDEGTDSICYYLSLNRALAIKDYVLGRGVDSSRIFSLKGWGNLRSFNRKTNSEILKYNCRAEIMLNYPLPPPPPLFLDKDEDGIADSEDKCPDEFGERVNGGCPIKDAIIVPFDVQQSSLNTITYKVLDSVIAILLQDPTISISINGHAYKKEGNKTVCDRLAEERAAIVKNYLLSRRINAPRIISVKSSGYTHPITAGRNPAEIARNSRAEIFLVHP